MSLFRILFYEKKVLYHYFTYLGFYKFLSDLFIFRANLIFSLYLCKQKQHAAFTKKTVPTLTHFVSLAFILVYFGKNNSTCEQTILINVKKIFQILFQSISFNKRISYQTKQTSDFLITSSKRGLELEIMFE